MTEHEYWDIMRPVCIHARNMVVRRIRIAASSAHPCPTGSGSVDAMALVFGYE